MKIELSTQADAPTEDLAKMLREVAGVSVNLQRSHRDGMKGADNLTIALQFSVGLANVVAHVLVAWWQQSRATSITVQASTPDGRVVTLSAPDVETIRRQLESLHELDDE